MTLNGLVDSSAAWFIAFLAVSGVLAVSTGSVMEGAIGALLLVGLAFVLTNALR